MNQGFSKEVALQVSEAITKSSQKVYEKKWEYFVHWCGNYNIDPIKTNIPQVADFLQHLFKDKHLKPSTIKGYRSALGKVLIYCSNTDITNSSVLSDLIGSFEHEQPLENSSFPKWNLRLVLESLTKKPYEPLHEATLKFLTFKTVFLITLASGARMSEIHALDISNIIHEGNWKVVTLSPNPKFKAKNYDYSSGRRNFVGFKLESLKHRLGPGLEEENYLCPVRALRFYLDRTKDLRGKGQTQLFVSIVGKHQKAVVKNTIASWVKHTVLKAYENCSKTEIETLKISAHEVRALATSTAFYGNTALEEVLKAARWSQQTTFTSFYLRDMSQDLQGISRLGPLMVAQHKL